MLRFLWRRAVSEEELPRPWSGKGGVAINPSFARVAGGMAWAWREAPSWEGPFEAMWQGPGGEPERMADLFRRFGFGDVVADPKVWRQGDGLAVTFNSGWDRERNRLYVARIWPEVGAPEEVGCPGRQRVEKNWGFFEADGRVQVLYGLSPVPVFMASAGGEFLPVAEGEPVGAGRTLGSQPVFWGGRWYVMGHRRGWIRGKRWYVAELWSFGRVGSGWGDVRRESGPWAHSPVGLLGGGRKRNRNLLSCTYCSGLERADGGWWVGYGLNDRSAHVAWLPDALSIA